MSFHSLRPSPLSRRERRALGSTTGEQVRFVRDYNRRSWRQNRIFRQEPYPKAQDVFIRCGEANSDEDFNDLNVQDFVMAHKRMARKKLERIAMGQYTKALLSRGCEANMDAEDENDVVETSIGYTAAVGAALAEEIKWSQEEIRRLQDEVKKVNTEAHLLHHHAQEYIDDVVETMGNALLGRVYDLESKHQRGVEGLVGLVESQSQAIRDLTNRVDEMVIDRDGLVETAGSSSATLVDPVVMRLEDVQMPPVYEVVRFDGREVAIQRAQADEVYQPVIDLQAEVDEQRGEVYQEANSLADRMWRAGSVQGGRLPEYTRPPRYTPRVEARIEEVPQVPLSDVEEELYRNIL